jgi:hypothetical protein
VAWWRMGWGILRVAMAMYVTCQVRSRLFSTGSVMRMKFSKWWAMAADPTRIGDTQLQNQAGTDVPFSQN